MTSQFVAGILGQPFGLEGFVKLRSLSGETAHLARLPSMLLRRNGGETRMRVEAVKVRGDGEVLVRFAGFDSPEKAKTLSGSEVIVDRKDAAPLGEGEFYIEDLKGLRLVADRKAGGTEKVFGIIIGVVEGGGGLLLEIQSGGDAADSGTRFIPFRKEFIGEVLPEEGTVVLRAPWALA